MTYTNPWVDNAVSGTQLATAGPADFNQIRLDVHQRMNDIVQDWTADPVVLKANISGAVTGKIMYVSGFGFNYGQLLPGQNVTYAGNGTIISAGGVTPAIVPPTLFTSVALPQGITITKLTALVDAMTSSSVIVKLGNLISIPIPPAPLSVSIQSNSLSIGPQILQSGVINYVNGGVLPSILPSSAFWLSVNSAVVTTSFQVYWVAITYNTPSAQSTL